MPRRNRLLDAAWEVHRFLTHHQIPYVIIGGLAVQHWGEPRATLDVDMTVMFPHVTEFVHLVSARFRFRVANPVEFARRTRVVPIQATNTVPVDIALGVPGYEDTVMQRAVEYAIARGRRVRLCSAEDLVIHKALAGRDRDLADLKRIIQKQGERLEVTYIRHWLRIFADLLADDEPLARFERVWRAEKRAARKSSLKIHDDETPP